MFKVMLFIDGSWLYRNVPRLSDVYGLQDFRVDFGKLPQVLSEELSKQMGGVDIDVVRTYLFGSCASNYDLRDEDAVRRQRDFFDRLKEEYHYELEIFPINFKGRRLRRSERDPKDTFEPQEKCVDISLATSMLYFASIPYAYDIAIAVVGDQDFKPVLQSVRRLGKRIAIASIKGSCAQEYADPKDEARVKDFDIIWLDELLERLELKYERHQLECNSPMHVGDKKVWTTFHPRKGQKFFCSECQTEFTKQKREAQQEYVSTQVEDVSNGAPGEAGENAFGSQRTGTVKKKVSDRGFGFIHTNDGGAYFFHLTDLQQGLEFEEVDEGLLVDFEVKKEPSQDKAGAAQNVRRHMA